MTCGSCGMPCQGARCRDCERMERQEDYYGTPSEIRERREGPGDDDE